MSIQEINLMQEFNNSIFPNGKEKELFLVLAHCVFSEIAPTSSIDGRRNQEIT